MNLVHGFAFIAKLRRAATDLQRLSSITLPLNLPYRSSFFPPPLLCSAPFLSSLLHIKFNYHSQFPRWTQWATALVLWTQTFWRDINAAMLCVSKPDSITFTHSPSDIHRHPNQINEGQVRQTTISVQHSQCDWCEAIFEGHSDLLRTVWGKTGHFAWQRI